MRTGVNTLALLGAAAFAAMAPILFSASSVPAPQTAAFPGWPRHYESRPLTPLKLSQREQVFVQGFPGEVGRFSDGSREIIVRWVESPTRRLHPAADCFRGVGYTITPLQVQHNRNGTAMGCFSAEKKAQRLRVCEYIADTKGHTWTDVSSWYWHTVLGDARGGWWSFVVAERTAAGSGEGR